MNIGYIGINTNVFWNKEFKNCNNLQPYHLDRLLFLVF